MRKLVRPDSPRCLSINAAQWTEVYLARRREMPAARFTWRGSKCYASMRDDLFRMTRDHCAFCDGPVNLESRATVEHFRPKSTFPELAYTWTNLFPCCDKCQQNKGEHFDDRLLKPDEDLYTFAKYFICNYRNGELEPAPEGGQLDRERVVETIRIYDLNSPLRKAARRREWEFFQRHDAPDIDDFHYRFFLE
ncbi:HNH endonuclease [Caballeronia sp. dw_276]|uniref:HNH endonuclease n=1 Tax=Caballeronia sp. dw_276 TaxID=2719795 RepID=UPI001BD31E7D|nr:HNH endonuclease [Caballeronia sp. dw_276]